MKNTTILILVSALFLALVAACGSDADPGQGQDLALQKGCLACHAVEDGESKVGPTWAGLYNSQVELSDGTTVTADEVYLAEAIADPNATIVSGYSKGTMPEVPLTDEEVRALVEYIKTLE